MSFFNINFRNKNETGAIGIIGGEDGPTAVFTAKFAKNKKEKQEKFLLNAAERITPCERTFKQLEEYLVAKYLAVPHTLLPHELNAQKANVILNYFPNVLDKPVSMKENMTEEDIKAYFVQDTSFLQAREYPAEKLGLELKAYKLSVIPSKIKQKRGLKHKKQSVTINASYTENDVIVEMEMKSEYLCICNDGYEIMDDLLFYRGVSQEDIQEKSQRFVAYAYALRRMGKL